MGAITDKLTVLDPWSNFDHLMGWSWTFERNKKMGEKPYLPDGAALAALRAISGAGYLPGLVEIMNAPLPRAKRLPDGSKPKKGLEVRAALIRYATWVADQGKEEKDGKVVRKPESVQIAEQVWALAASPIEERKVALAFFLAGTKVMPRQLPAPPTTEQDRAVTAVAGKDWVTLTSLFRGGQKTPTSDGIVISSPEDGLELRVTKEAITLHLKGGYQPIRLPSEVIGLLQQ